MFRLSRRERQRLELASLIMNFENLAQPTPASWSSHGDELATRGDDNGALAAYEQALHLEPKFVPALIGRGILSYRFGSWDKAIADFTLVLRAEPNNVSAHLNRANALHQRGDVRRAVEDYTRALELEPENWRAFLGRSLAWSDLGEHRNAEHDQQMAAELAGEAGVEL